MPSSTSAAAEMSDEPLDSDAPQVLRLYRQMKLIRRFEETILEILETGSREIDGPFHPYIGQEAVATGLCGSLRPDDKIVSTHRGHGHCIAKGADPARMMAELFGKRTGYCKGRGGSMHIADFEAGVLGANGIVAAGMPIASGAALAEHMTGTDNVVACMFGDGAAGAGPLHETLNIAALWNLPLVFVCENNGWSVNSQPSDVLAPAKVIDLGVPYGIPGRVVDGNDVFAVCAAARWAVARARRGEGPSMVEARTFRTGAHAIRHVVPPEQRDPGLLAEWQAKDPIERVALHATTHSLADEAALRSLDESVEAELDAAVRFARESPFPEPAEALEDVFAS